MMNTSGPAWEAVCEHAELLGMDPNADRELMWIAERSLNAPLPPGWKQEMDETHQTPYYFSDMGHPPQWEHPSDDEFREMFRVRKAQGPPFDPPPDERERPPDAAPAAGPAPPGEADGAQSRDARFAGSAAPSMDDAVEEIDDFEQSFDAEPVKSAPNAQQRQQQQGQQQ